MSENFYVEEDKVEVESQTILYDKDGKVVDDKDGMFFMKEVITNHGTKYFLMFNKSELVNPLGENTFFRNYDDLKPKKVGAKAAKLYLRYLQEKNSRYFTLCRRDLDA
jgi:hypothetical protein